MRAIWTVFTVAMVWAAAACGDAPEPAARGSSPEATGRGEISRAEAVADAETARIAIDTPEVRRELVENAWRFDVDTLEIECWGVGMNQSAYYTARLPNGQRIGPPAAFSDGVFRVPDQGPYGVGPVDGVRVELPDVVQDDRLTGLGGRGRADMLARRVCSGQR